MAVRQDYPMGWGVYRVRYRLRDAAFDVAVMRGTSYSNVSARPDTQRVTSRAKG